MQEVFCTLFPSLSHGERVAEGRVREMGLLSGEATRLHYPALARKKYNIVRSLGAH
jgi:hypothetical protein